jgi:hypothetical protein
MGRLGTIGALDPGLWGVTGGAAARRFGVIVIYVVVIGRKFGVVRVAVAVAVVAVLAGPVVPVMRMRRPDDRPIGGVAMGSFRVRAVIVGGLDVIARLSVGVAALVLPARLDIGVAMVLAATFAIVLIGPLGVLGLVLRLL